MIYACLHGQATNVPGRPSLWHEYRKNVLDSIAVLAGCAESTGTQLPDGVRPDVLRFDTGKRMMFVGDAKDSETPGCAATEARLLTYFRWGKAFVLSGGTLVFVVCFGRISDDAGWLSLLCQLCDEVGLAPSSAACDQLDYGLRLAWIVVR